MTNLLSLPQIPAGTSMTISGSADFNDQIFVGIPNFPSTPLTITGNVDGAASTITGITSTAGLVPGMSVSGYGIRSGSLITVVNPTALTLNNTTSVAVTGGQFTMLPPPLDLTGISFNSMLRASVTSTTVIIQMSTANGLMTNGMQNGTFGWLVRAAKLPAWPGLSAIGTLSLVMDVTATDITGAIVNLCVQNGPIPVTVLLPVTR